MKVLSTEQQTELQELLENIAKENLFSLQGEWQTDLQYWAIALKPKRVRKVKSVQGGVLTNE